MSKMPNRSWFAGLRRDGGLFALLGTLLLLLAMLQPLAAAQAGDDGDWVICTIHGSEKPLDTADLPSAMPENCPACVSGHHCASAPPVYKAALASEPAFPSMPAFLLTCATFDTPRLPTTRLGDPPPAIRAPPLSA